MSKAPVPPVPAQGAVGALARAGLLLEAVFDEIAELGDDDLVMAMQRIGAVGRLADGLRSRAAGEADLRSRRPDADATAAAPLTPIDAPGDSASGSAPRPGARRLSSRYGCRSAGELIERAIGSSPRASRAWIRLDQSTRPRITLTGDSLPARFPAVADAVRAGRIDAEAAREIVSRLDKVAEHGARPADLAEAERTAVDAMRLDTIHDLHPEAPPRDDAATGDEASEDRPVACSHRGLGILLGRIEAHLDRGSLESDAAEATRRRGLNLGRERDGLVHVWGDLIPETAGGLVRLIDAYKGSTVAFAEPPSEHDENTPWSGDDLVPEERTPAQLRHDILTAVIQAAARAADAPTIGGAAPTLLVSIEHDQLDGGTARIDRIDQPVPAAIAHRIACTGAVQKILTRPDGRILALGSPERCFTPHQRRAIAHRDGGCIIPGCDVPAAWCEIHHVEEHSRGGPTHPDNGVMLCWWHHHNLDASGWLIRMRGGIPLVAAPRWIDPTRKYRPAINPARHRPNRSRHGPNRSRPGPHRPRRE